MRIPNDINEIPFKTLIYAKKELNKILNNRTDFNDGETTDILRYMIELIKQSSLATEEELDEKNVQWYNNYFGITHRKENNYKCLKEVVEYINYKLRVHNFYEMLKD